MLNPRLREVLSHLDCCHRSILHKSGVVGQWCLPFPGSDRPVMYRSQRYLYEHDKIRPVQVHSYVGFSSMLSAILVAVFTGIFALLTKTAFTRNLLLKVRTLFVTLIKVVLRLFKAETYYVSRKDWSKWSLNNPDTR